MEIIDIIARRRAIYPEQYTDEPISRESLETILITANWAPTHKKTEPWRFKVLQGDAIGRMADFLAEKYIETTPPESYSAFKEKKLRNKPRMANAIIAICMQRDLKERLPEWEEVAATAMAVQNMWLTASEMDLGCYWSSPGLISELHEFFDFAEGERCLGFLYLGHYLGDRPEGKRDDIKDKVEWLNE